MNYEHLHVNYAQQDTNAQELEQQIQRSVLKIITQRMEQHHVLYVLMDINVGKKEQLELKCFHNPAHLELCVMELEEC